MKSCQVASVVGAGVLVVMTALAACHERPAPDVPGPTTARPAEVGVGEAARSAGDVTSADSGAPDARVTVGWLEGPTQLKPPPCSRLFVIAARGTATVGTETLADGDVLVLARPDGPIDVRPTGLVVHVSEELVCGDGTPRRETTKVSGKDAPPLVWANGTMRAHLDVGTQLSPSLYIGRLEGTAGVAEHEHANSTETIVAIEASGTFTIDGEERRLGPRQIVRVPKGKKHAWKPDPGSKLVAIQVYEPPGPEQRFIGLARAARDSAKDAGAAAPPRR